MQITTPFLFLVTLHIIAGQWIDPHSMNTRLKSKIPNSSEDIPKQNSQKSVHVTEKPCSSVPQLKRMIRIILSNAYLDNELGYHEGYINIRLTDSEHKLLVQFSENDDHEHFSEINTIFENAFQKPATDRYPELILSMQEKLYELIFNPTSTALAGACLALYMTYKLLRAQFTWKSIVKYFLFLAYVADFVVTYLHVVQEEEIESMVNLRKLGTVPPECDPQKMSWWTFIKTQFESTFVENPCKAYYQATYQKYLHMIAPSKILTRQFRTFLVEPFGDIGEAFGKFGRGMFTTLPWGLNLVMFPIMLVTTMGMVFIFFLFITKPHFKISLFHLFTIELGQNARNDTLRIENNENRRRQIAYTPNRVRNGRNRNNGREVGSATNHRPLIEEVSNNNSSSQDDQKKVKTKEIRNGENLSQGPTGLLEKDNQKSDNSTVSDESSIKSDV